MKRARVKNKYECGILNRYLSLEKTGILANEILYCMEENETERCRYLVSDWIFEVTIEFKFSIKSYHLAITYFDIFLNRIEVHKEDYQLVILACFSLANKMNEISPILIHTCEYISDGSCKENEIIQVEKMVFDTLNNKLIVPILYDFMEIYVDLLKDNSVFIWSENEQFFVNSIISFVTMVNIEQFKYLPSFLVLCCILVTKEYNSKIKYTELIKNYFTEFSYTYDELSFGYSVIRKIIHELTKTNLKSIKIYLKDKFNDEMKNYFSEDYDLHCTNSYNILRPKHVYIKEEILTNKDINKEMKIGEGSYSTVYKVKIDNKDKAFKKMNEYVSKGIDHSILKEISILKYVSHPNLLHLENVVFSQHKQYYGVVLELMEKDLSYVIKNLTHRQIKIFSKQLLQAVYYLHLNGIIHRDIKTPNILIKGDNIKLADYGTCRTMTLNTGQYTNTVGTLWYRPIENLLGINEYDFSVDIWSCACVIGEMVGKKIMFPGDSEIDMIHRIMRLFGKEKIKKAYSSLPNWKIHFPMWKESSMKLYLNSGDILTIDLLEYMFEIDNTKRPTAQNILLHKWFN